jgi:hypothetical protein
MTVRIAPRLHRALHEMAGRERVSVRQLIEWTLREAIVRGGHTAPISQNDAGSSQQPRQGELCSQEHEL